MEAMTPQDNITFRVAKPRDIDALLEIEERCFEIDRLSRRSFKNAIESKHSLLLVIEEQDKLVGYGLVFLHKGTRLARLYSLAIDPQMRGKKLGQRLLLELESIAAEQGRLYMRLEVAKHNQAAIQLYTQLNYRIFGEYSDYYEDHSDALRMQKTIRHFKAPPAQHKEVRWYRQSTEFTCGPASLMMAMGSLDKDYQPNQEDELDIWREATTIFMTSGHGGFSAHVTINTDKPLFLEGVRSSHKKSIMETVDRQFTSKAIEAGILIEYVDVTQDQIEQWLKQGYAVLLLISTYRLDGKKAPHWVTVTGIDEYCFYVHDPDLDSKKQLPIDCQYVPIARDDFSSMSAFGSNRLRTAIAIQQSK